AAVAGAGQNTEAKAKGGLLGPRGTFSEGAARQYDKRRAAPRELVPYPRIPTVLRAVDRRVVGWAGVAIENALERTVPTAGAVLGHEVQSPICGEVVLEVRHNLLARDPVPLDRVEKVLSHPQALAQCRGWLERMLPHARREPVGSTA